MMWFLDPDKGKEVTIASSSKLLAAKMREAGISTQHIKGNSLRISGDTAYGNSRNEAV